MNITPNLPCKNLLYK